VSLGKTELVENVILSNHTSIRIGGEAQCFYIADSVDDLSNIISSIGSDFYFLGKGSNLLVNDSLIKKPVVKLGENFIYLRGKENLLEIGASTPLSYLIKYCLENNLSGVENLAGIPATVGGLIAMNAGSFGQNISSNLIEVDVMDRKGNFKTLKEKEITFKYRFSSLQDYIILGAKLKFLLGDNLKQKISKCLTKRFSRQDFNFPSCGSVFKNTPKASAGYLIDSLQLKGLRKGDAQISLRHANFIVNRGAAKYSDVDYLIQKIKDQIYKKYSIILQEETKRWE